MPELDPVDQLLGRKPTQGPTIAGPPVGTAPAPKAQSRPSRGKKQGPVTPDHPVDSSDASAEKQQAQQGLNFILSGGQQQPKPTLLEPHPAEQVLGPSLANDLAKSPFSGIPDNVQQGLRQRLARSAVPQELQNPSFWNDDYKKKLEDPNSVDSRLHAWDQQKYGMPTFGYVKDPERDQYKKQVTMETQPGNIYSEGKALDWHLDNAGIDLPADVRTAAIGYMMMKSGAKDDTDPIPVGMASDVANTLSNPKNWQAFKDQVDQMKATQDAIKSRPELAFLNEDYRKPTQTQARQHDPSTIEGQMAIYDMAHYGKLTFGQNETPARAAYRQQVTARMGMRGNLLPGESTQQAGVGAMGDLRGTNEQLNKLGLPGTRPTSGAPFLEEGSGWMQRGQDGSYQGFKEKPSNILSKTAESLGQMGAWSLQAAANLGMLPAAGPLGYVAQTELAARGAHPFQDPSVFEKGYRQSVTGTLGQIGADFAPYAIPGFGQLAFGAGMVQQFGEGTEHGRGLLGGLEGLAKGTGIPDAIKTLDDPNTTWQEKTQAFAALATGGLMLFHVGHKGLNFASEGFDAIKRWVAPVDVPVSALHQEWLNMPEDVLGHAVRLREEIANGLHNAGATDPSKVEGHATAAATFLARAAQNIENAGGESASSLLSKVKFSSVGGFEVPEALGKELEKVSAPTNISQDNPPAPTGAVLNEKGHVELGQTNFWTPTLGKHTARVVVMPLEELVASNRADTFAINPDYPEHLQPRDRTQEKYKMQVGKIVSQFDHERQLEDFHKADEGSPIVFGDGSVISGNGRTMALQKLAAGLGNKKAWADYQARVKTMAGGLADNMKNPVIVRVMDDMPVDQARTFAEDANRSSGMSMGTTESAIVGAGKIPPNFWESMNQVGASIDSTLKSPKNRGVITRWLQTLSENERGQFLTPDGALNRAGREALKSTALADLVGEGGQRFMERLEGDDVSNRLENGLFRAMPDLLKSKSPELSDALNALFDEYHKFKTFQSEQGYSWEQYKNQPSLEHVPESLQAVFHALGDALTTGGSDAKVEAVLKDLVSSGTFREIADKLAGQDPLFSSERSKDPWLVVRNFAPSFEKLIIDQGGKALGDSYFAIKNGPEARMLIDQAGVQVDRPRTNDYNKRYANQGGLFGEDQATGETSPPEPIQETLFSKGTERAGDKITTRADIVFDNKTGEALIRLGKGATVAEVAHETAHYLERQLTPDMLKQVSDALGFDGEWTVENKERFARAFELYLTEKASVPGADSVMAHLAQAVRNVYENRKVYDADNNVVKSTPEESVQWQAEPHIGEGTLEVPDSLRAIFDDMTKNPESWPGMAAPVQNQDKVTQDGNNFNVEQTTGNIDIKANSAEDTAKVKSVLDANSQTPKQYVVKQTPEGYAVFDTGENNSQHVRVTEFMPDEAKANQIADSLENSVRGNKNANIQDDNAQEPRVEEKPARPSRGSGRDNAGQRGDGTSPFDDIPEAQKPGNEKEGITPEEKENKERAAAAGADMVPDIVNEFNEAKRLLDAGEITHAEFNARMDKFRSGERGPIDDHEQLFSQQRGRVEDVGEAFTNARHMATRYLTYGIPRLTEEAPNVATAAGKFGQTRGHIQTILTSTAVAMKRVTGDANTIGEFRKFATVDRLYGLEQRWRGFADDVNKLDDAKFLADYKKWGDIADMASAGISSRIQAMIDAGHSDLAKIAIRSVFEDAATRVGKNADAIMAPDQYDEYRAKPEYQALKDAWMEHAQDPLQKIHLANDGVLTDALGPEGLHLPLIGLDAGGQPVKGGRASRGKNKVVVVGGRGVLSDVPNLSNKFATGLAPGGYDLSPGGFHGRILRDAFMSNKGALIDSLKDAGLVREVDDATFNNYQKQQAQGNLSINPLTGNDVPAITLESGGKKYIVAEHAAKEIGHLLDTKSPFNYSDDMNAIVQRLTKWQLAGVIEPLIHSRNLFSALVSLTPYLNKDPLSMTIGNVSVTKLPYAMLKAARTDVFSPEGSRMLRKLADNGALPNRAMETTIDKHLADQTGANVPGFMEKTNIPISSSAFLFGPSGLDMRVRVMLGHVAEQMGLEGRQFRDFVNQAGAYNPAYASVAERFFKRSGLGPFYTAGQAFNIGGAKALIGQMPGANMGERVLQSMSGGIAGAFATWYVASMIITGKPPAKNEKLGEIPIGNGKSINAFWLTSLVERGLRVTGVKAAYDAKAQGANNDQALDAGFRQVLNAWSHPATSGATVHAGMTAIGGVQPYLTSTTDMTGRQNIGLLRSSPDVGGGLKQRAVNAGYALLNINPMIGKIAESTGLVPPVYKPHAGDTPDEDMWQALFDYTLPQLRKHHDDPEAKKEKFEQQAKATATATGENTWMKVSDEMSPDSIEIIRQFQLNPEPRRAKNETPEAYKTRLKSMAKTWDTALKNLKSSGLTGDALRKQAEAVTRASFRKSRGSSAEY